jgi:hypothetical protein
MVVDVLYDGLPLQTGAQVREEPGGAFIELEAPMPVGTTLTLRSPEGERAARVEKVHEGVGSGVLVKFVENGAAAETDETAAEGEADDAAAAEKKPDQAAAPSPSKKRKGRKGR